MNHLYNDRQLINAILQGDAGAVDVLYERYADPLYAFLWHRLGGKSSDVEDVWQESLIAAFQNLGSFHGDSAFFTWLCGIARHKLSDSVRRRTDKNLSMDSLEETSSEIQVEGAHDNHALYAQVVEALGMVPADYRQALQIRYAEDQPVWKVALRIHRGYKATESLLARARSAFREAFLQVQGKEER